MRKTWKLWYMFLVISICLAIPQKAYAATVNEKESNNSFETANIINSGDTIKGSITEEDEYDFFKFNLPDAGLVQMEWTTYMTCCCISIYDTDGECVWNAVGNEWNSSAGYGKNTHKTYLEKGTYYLKISGYYYETWGQKGAGNYTCYFRIEDTLRNNREPDNVFAEANTTNLGDTLKGQISANDERDIWKLQLHTSGRVYLDTTSYMQFYFIDLYDESGERLWESGERAWNEKVGYRKDQYEIDLEAGIYYLEVNGYQYNTWGGTGTGIFDIQTSFEAANATNTEPDNSFIAANRITMGTLYRGLIAQNDELDTYCFLAPASRRIQIDITSWMNYCGLKVFDSNGNEVWTAQDNKPNENTEYCKNRHIVELGSGTYYLQIDGYKYASWAGRSTGIYQFQISEKGLSKVSYILNGGTNASNPTVIDGSEAQLRDPKRKGYDFSGWYLDSAYQNRIEKLPKKSDDDMVLYAKWEKVNVDKPSIYRAYNQRGRKIYLYYGGSSYASGYEITYAYNKKLTSGKKTVRTGTTSRTLKKLKKRRNVYIRVRAFKYDSAGSRVYSKYSSLKKVRVRY